MVARKFEELGSIGATQSETNNKPYSIRGKDGDRFQTLSFICDRTRPFTGLVILEGCVTDPTYSPDKLNFYTLVELNFYGERDTIFIETSVETSLIRIRSISYDSKVIASSKLNSKVSASGGSFKIDGITVTVGANASLSTVASAITIASIPNITVDTTTLSNVLLIRKTTTDPMTLQDTVNTPLTDLGFLDRNDASGSIITLNPSGRIIQIQSMR